VTDEPPGEPLRRNRDFTLFWCGQLVSTLGSRITSIGYPLLVLAETGSGGDVGAVAFAQGLPFLLWFLPAGALVDRGDRKRIMLACDVVRLAGLSVLVGAIAADRLSVPLVAAVAFVEGTAFVFFELSEAAALPQIVPRRHLASALAGNQARVQGADLLGQPAGGLLFSVGRAVPFVADAASYLVSFVTLLFVRPAFQGERAPSPGLARLGAEMREGIAWLVRQPVLRAIVVLVAASNLAFNALTIVLILRAESLGASPGVIGVMLAFFGAGAIVGSAVAPRLTRRLSLRAVVVGSMWAWAASMVALAPLRSALALGAVAGLGAVVGPVFNVAVAAYRYAATPDELQGRALSAARAVAWGTIPLGGLAAGLLVESVGAAPALAVLGGYMVAVAAVASVLPSLRRAAEPHLVAR
jgi:MFS family permease